MTDPTHDSDSSDEANAVAGRVIVLDIVGLQSHHIDGDRMPSLDSIFSSGTVTDLKPRFPAVTVPCQTTLSTGRAPEEHGDIANGEYDRERDAAEFWERDRDGRTRLWEAASDEAGLTTGVLFFQHLIGTNADVAVTPSPIEDEDNNLLEMNCWTNPDDFYDDLEEQYGHFPLHSYWGPGASAESSEWILSAARESVERFDPDLLWVYVPHLDYVGQSDGPDSDAFAGELEVVDEMIGDFLSFLRDTDRWDETVVNLVSEYGFHDVDRVAFPNRVLRAAGLLETDDENDVAIAQSDAFAMVDHQIAHVYVDDNAAADACAALEELEGVDEILAGDAKDEWGVGHPNAGEFVLVADDDAWFQYYWWDERKDAPPYATDMDIHKKPGFDPCELFFGDEGLVSLDPTQVEGSHGRVDDGTYGCYALGGPATPDLDLDGSVDATVVAPTITDLLGVSGHVSLPDDPSALD